uniref:hypothetical protein n=1 Tax=Chroothece richteriana TaxID=101928 RepID=UPI001FCD8324|nr:hypothetical protein MW631_pgp147 [Chroothece richteriana]UNJ14161.1 hypothetical protein [Chroothece richteriana]
MTDTHLYKVTSNYQKDIFVLISIQEQRCCIHVKYINPQKKINEVFSGYTARDLLNKILLKYDSSLNNSHSAYLGRELMKAEISLILQQKYIQS